MNDSYAKVFGSMFIGSMYGAGMNVFAVWTWILANKDERGLLEINPTLVAHQLGGDVEEVESALEYLCQPDPASRSKDEDGRRIVHISAFTYRVVNHAVYRERGRDRTAYWRDWRAKNRKEAQP